MRPANPPKLDGVASARVADLATPLQGRLLELPVVLRILLENNLRTASRTDSEAVVSSLLRWLDDGGTSDSEIAFTPTRLLMHDTTCVPALMLSSWCDMGG